MKGSRAAITQRVEENPYNMTITFFNDSPLFIKLTSCHIALPENSVIKLWTMTKINFEFYNLFSEGIYMICEVLINYECLC